MQQRSEATAGTFPVPGGGEMRLKIGVMGGAQTPACSQRARLAGIVPIFDPLLGA